MKNVSKYLVPALILFVIVGFPILNSFWASIHVEWRMFNLRIAAFLSPLAICTSFFLTSLIIKNKKHILWFIILYFVYLSSPLWIDPILTGMKFPVPASNILTDVTFHIVSFLSFLRASLIGALYYLGFNWLKKNRQLKELEKQNLQSELALLKNQINPHFLFNTLNNIDSLIKSNPDHASQSLIELSDMMRYMLYETNVDRVPLQKEIDYIDDYLKLQKMQYANAHLVDYTVSGNTEGITVAPMLFIPFIENAFKHCTDKEKEHAIQISIVMEVGHIRFRTSNISDSNHVISKDSSSGIGLETVKRRLEILYQGKHSLLIIEKNNLFCVELNIDIND